MISRTWLTGLLVLLLGLGGCAYFNTFSNAKKAFREAEAVPLNPNGNLSPNARKKYDASISKCQKLIDLYPDSKWIDDAYFMMGKAYFNKREYNRCLRRLNELDERFPDHPYREEELYLRGISNLENGEESRAIAIFQKLEDDYPKSDFLAEGLFRSGEAEFRLANWEPALDSYLRLLERFEHSDWNDKALLQSARSRRELDQDQSAIELLLTLSENGLDRRTVFEGDLLRAEILYDLKQYGESRTLLEELEETSVNFQSKPQTMLLLARVLEVEGDLERTKIMLENIATEFPRTQYAAEAWYRIGLIKQLRDEDVEGAIEAYNQVSQEQATSIYANLAKNKKRALNEFLEAREFFEGTPGDSTAVLRQFRMAENQFLHLEDTESALAEYRKVLQLYPDSEMAPNAAYAIAVINRYDLTDTTTALAAVGTILNRYPDSEAARFVAHWPGELGAGQADSLGELVIEPPPPPPPVTEPDEEASTESAASDEPDTESAAPGEAVTDSATTDEPEVESDPAGETVVDPAATDELNIEPTTTPGEPVVEPAATPGEPDIEPVDPPDREPLSETGAGS